MMHCIVPKNLLKDIFICQPVAIIPRDPLSKGGCEEDNAMQIQR
jgi:hypothetical protein